MKHYLISAFATLVLPMIVAAAEHPRLLFSAGDVPALRSKVLREPFKSMLQQMITTAERDHWGTAPAEKGDDYSELISMHRCAFLYVVTGDDAWAAKSRKYAEQRLADKAAIGNARTKGLTLYVHGVFLSMAYDWCYNAPSWDAGFKAELSKVLKSQGDVIAKKGGSEQNRSAASNWQGLRWASAGICYLTTDEPIDPKAIDQCYQNVCGYLKANLGSGGSGWNCEGLGYNYYPMGNGVAPFGVAMQRKDPSKDIRKATPAAAYSLWTTYAATVVNTTGRWHPDFADDNPNAHGEGTLGFAFWMTPEELQPGLRFAYDRLVGTKGDKSFDSARFGTVASILYYPDAVKEQNPLKIPAWTRLFDDSKGNGMFTFRNSYGSEDDIVVQAFAKLIGNRGHAGPDSLSYRIYGFDGLWAVGGGRYGPKVNGQDAYYRSQNTLYPDDPDERLQINEERGKVIAAKINENGSGWVTLSAGRNNVGTANHVRRLYVTFDPATGAAAAIVLVDTSDNGKFFQHCTIENQKVTVAGNAFTIAGPTGNSLCGTVLFPADSKLATGTRLRGSKAGDFDQNNWITATTSEGNSVIVLTLQKPGQPAPPINATGNWAGANVKGTITIGKVVVKIDGSKFE